MVDYVDMMSLPLEDLHFAFLDAYQDYMFPMTMDFAAFQGWLVQRGFDPSLSMAVLDGSDIAAFWFVGQKQWERSHSAYAISVGCRPAWRRQGLSRGALLPLADLLREREYECLILEVIDGNDRAVALYRSAGFVDLRYLHCFGRINPVMNADLARGDFKVSPFAQGHGSASVCLSDCRLDDALSFIDAQGDWTPSWQNAGDAMRNTKPPLVIRCVRETDGLLAVGIAGTNGTLHQFATRKDQRKKGHASRLFEDIASGLGVSALSAMNVPSTAAETLRFLERRGAELLCSQFEMALPL